MAASKNVDKEHSSATRRVGLQQSGSVSAGEMKRLCLCGTNSIPSGSDSRLLDLPASACHTLCASFQGMTPPPMGRATPTRSCTDHVSATQRGARAGASAGSKSVTAWARRRRSLVGPERLRATPAGLAKPASRALSRRRHPSSDCSHSRCGAGTHIARRSAREQKDVGAEPSEPLDAHCALSRVFPRRATRCCA